MTVATQQTANIYLRNATDGVAYLQLFHQNSSNGTQNASWTAQPGQTVGPLVVQFETGFGSYGILDWWSVTMAVQGGSAPGTYQNTGTVAVPWWKECQLQHQDASQDMTLSVSSTEFDINLDSGGTTDTMTMLSKCAPITNVFVLMLENHSFDNIFGQSGIPGIVHASPGTTNSYNGVSYPVGSPAPVTMPSSPGHEFGDVVEQLGGQGATYPSGGPYPPINNSGFAANYATTTDEGFPPPAAAAIGLVMLGFDTPTELPVSYQLATEFALCDSWYSSIPGPTWPNRFFLHGASSAGLDHSPTTAEIIGWEVPGFGFAYPHGSVFQALTKAGIAWRLYRDDTDAYSDDPQNGSAFGAIPQVSALQGVTLLDCESLTRFASDLQGPYPYPYTFIEPNYGDVTGNTYQGGSSQHPTDDVYGGEGLVKAVYEAIRNSPVWNTSLLIVTYDEHGGFYDSVAPPPATPPNDGSGSSLNQSGFTFDRYGVRVPAVVVSPWIVRGTVDHGQYDHSSVAATLERMFGFPALTDRDAGARDLLGLLTLGAPRTDAPATLVNPAPPVPAAAATADLAGIDSQPIRLSGNLPGFLAAALKSRFELSTGSPADRDQLLNEFAAIRTRGQARDFLAKAAAEAHAAQGGLRL
jgi:phospholipase C